MGALRRSASFQLFVAFWIRICMVLLSLNGFISSLLASYFVKASAKNFKPFWTHARRVQARSYLSFLVDAHSREGMDILECLGSSSSQVGGVKKSALPLLCIVGMKDTLVRTHKTVETVRRLARNAASSRSKTVVTRFSSTTRTRKNGGRFARLCQSVFQQKRKNDDDE